jgi:hypothetical protein
MDRNKIVVPRASWSEEIFLEEQKIAFLKKEAKIKAGRQPHLQPLSLLSNDWGEVHLLKIPIG